MFLVFEKSALIPLAITVSESDANKVISDAVALHSKNNCDKIFLGTSEVEQIAKHYGKVPKEDLIQMVSILESDKNITSLDEYDEGKINGIQIAIDLIKTYQ